jgi:hypothetical protein
MQKHRLKNMLASGVALIVLVAWSSIASAQWTPLAHAFPSGFASTCLLLTDGTVMCHEYNTNRWHRLKPDINGSYQNGSWDVPGFTVADMPNDNDPTIGCVNCPYQPLYFASAVLPDGRVVVIGGEYNNLVPLWTNIGFVYNPVTNTWSEQITVPGDWCCAGGTGTGAICDAQSTILTNGTMLLANIAHTFIASFDPSTLTFTAFTPAGKDDINDEEGWNQLPNGTFLAVDSRFQTSFEVFDPLTNSWETRGSTVVNLADTGTGTVGSDEVGQGPAAGWHAYRLLWHEFQSERFLQHCNRHVGCNWRGGRLPGRPRDEPLRRGRWAGFLVAEWQRACGGQPGVSDEPSWRLQSAEPLL